MRKWLPTACDNGETGKTVYQIVVPAVHRQEVLVLPHDLPMSGHLGIRKTYKRILQHFYWPGLTKDVAKLCKECHTCQLGGKPNQNILQALYASFQLFMNLFRIYLLIVWGHCPKPSHKINAILKALKKFFTLFGLPKSIQSDQGTNFISHTFQQVMNQLGMKQYNSSAYHPESQGALERFHQTLKQ